LQIYIEFVDTLLVIGSVSPHMGDTVDEEGHVEGYTKSAVEQNPEGLPQALVPVVPWHEHRNGYDKYGEQRHIQPGKQEINTLSPIKPD